MARLQQRGFVALPSAYSALSARAALRMRFRTKQLTSLVAFRSVTRRVIRSQARSLQRRSTSDCGCRNNSMIRWSKEEIIALLTLLLAVPSAIAAVVSLWRRVERRRGRANCKLSKY